LLEINVGTRDTAADEMLTKKNGAKNPRTYIVEILLKLFAGS
jgi:hypothetical protein